MSIKQVQLRQLQAHYQEYRPSLHTFRPQGNRNDLLVQLWLAVDQIAKATGRDPVDVANTIRHNAHLQVGHLLSRPGRSQSRVESVSCPGDQVEG